MNIINLEKYIFIEYLNEITKKKINKLKKVHLICFQEKIKYPFI